MKRSQFWLLLVFIVAAPRMREPWALIATILFGCFAVASALKEPRND